MRSPLLLALSAVAWILIAQGCSDRITDSTSSLPDDQEVHGELLTCEFNLLAERADCTSETEEGSEENIAYNVILGDHGTFVTLDFGTQSWDAGTNLYSSDIAIENLTEVHLGTSDNSTPHSDGIRLFLHDQPTHGVSLQNPDGSASYTGSTQPYIEYDGLLDPSATSEFRTWTFDVPAGVESFYATFYVWTTIEDPEGDLLEPGGGGPTGVLSVSSWRATCVTFDDGEAYCFGFGGSGQTGMSTITSNWIPTDPVEGGHNWVHLDVGFNHNCGITTSGEGLCWGFGFNGALGYEASGTVYAPGTSTGSQEWNSISAGYEHSCGVTSSGDGYCWGRNDFGQLGSDDEDLTSTYEAQLVADNHDWSYIVAGEQNSCGITTSGAGYCWGDATYRAHGSQSIFDQYAPVPLSGGHTFVDIGHGGDRGCGLTDENEIWCWGSNMPLGGGLGVGEEPIESADPLRVVGGHDFTQMSVGTLHACGLTATGDIYCWGHNSAGQIDPENEGFHVYSPTQVGVGYTWQYVVAGMESTCGITGGELRCWGVAGSGKLGDGTDLDSVSPEFFVYFGPEITTLDASHSNLSISLGQSAQVEGIGLTATSDEVHGLRYRWSSSDESVATVDEYGLVTGENLGSADITLERSSSNDTYDLSLSIPVTVEELWLRASIQEMRKAGW